jgi:hypothetical protein
VNVGKPQGKRNDENPREMMGFHFLGVLSDGKEHERDDSGGYEPIEKRPSRRSGEVDMRPRRFSFGRGGIDRSCTEAHLSPFPNAREPRRADRAFRYTS